MDRLAAMEVFVRVVETGSFSAAARQLHVGQPAVSKTVAQLEERLAARLLLRSTRGLMPTEAGQNFYERAKRAIEEADEADLAARGASASLSGDLRVSAAVTFSRLHIVPRLSSFLAEHPALRVHLELDDQNVDLIQAGIDVALRMGSLEESRLTARKVAQSPRKVFGTPAYFERCGEPRTPGDLSAHEAIVYDVGGGGTAWTFTRGSTEMPIVVDGRVRVTAAEGVREAVFANLGLAIASQWMFAPELERGIVRAVLQEWSLPSIDLWAVFPTGHRVSAKARAFVAFVESILAPGDEHKTSHGAAAVR